MELSKAEAYETPVENPALRRQRLRVLVEARGFARVGDLSAELGVSEVTVRSDLNALERAGFLRRVHGGATALPPAVGEASMEETATRESAWKESIGRATAARVSSGNCVMLDVGSTALAVARSLVGRAELHGLVVVTNGLAIALALEPAIPRFTVVVTGGTLRPLQHSLVDPGAEDALGRLNADIAVIGCNGIDRDGEITNLNLPEATLKRRMMARSATRVLVADASKFGSRHLGSVGRLSEFDALVTAGPVPEWLGSFGHSGIELVDADPA